MTRLYAVVDNEDVCFSHPAFFKVSESGSRIVAGVPESDPAILLSLIEELSGPFSLLYVLHTPRSEGLAGRYQSPKIDAATVGTFLNEFRTFLMSDGRFDLWVHCFGTGSTLVWDRHDFLFAYGNVEFFEHVLEDRGFSTGQLEIPSPHSHHYLATNDLQAAELLKKFEWARTGLRKDDEQ